MELINFNIYASANASASPGIYSCFTRVANAVEKYLLIQNGPRL